MIEVPRASYKDKPIYLNNNPNQCYKRNYEGDYRCSSDEVKIMMRDSSEDILDNTILEGFELEEAIKVIRYPNYFEFQNPGGLKISREEFFRGEHSKPRNNIIQEIFRFLNLCERAGSGVPKILKAVREKSYKYPDIEEKEGMFIFKFWDVSEIESADDLENQEKEILKYIIKYKKINNKAAREELEFTKHQATDVFNKLMEKDYIEKQGSGRGVYYVMKYSKEKQKIKLLGDISEIFDAIKKSI